MLEITLKNIKEFLSYLESKGILKNSLVENKSSMKTMIKEILCLDLVKFAKSSCIGSLKEKKNLNSSSSSGSLTKDLHSLKSTILSNMSKDGFDER